MAKVYHWAGLTGPELAALAGPSCVAVLPIAAIEQHGAHLPLATDVIIGDGLLQAALAGPAATDAPRLVLPSLALGASLEHTGFAGTISLSAETAMATIESVGTALARAGIRRLMLFNSHGGNKAVVDLAALKLRAAHRMLVVKANYFRFAPPADALPAAELAHGLHGGALETSLMLHFAADQVRMDRAGDAVSLGARMAEHGARLGPEGDAGFAWMAQDLHPGGVTGNARLASAECGARLCRHFAGRLAELIDETARFDLAALA
ncbi:creatininase family protein [Salinisphaera sp. T31B1]|uniref:creatininase family protein n=1 Tax=Salinisphaera sp. T31B1 TaxID=727963 RepID=UPI00333FEEBA